MDGGDILTETDRGRAGGVDINARGATVTLSGQGTRLSAQANERGGQAGDVSVTTPSLIVEDRARLSASNMNSQIGGNVIIDGLDSLLLDGGGVITAETEGGTAGDVEIEAPGGTTRLSGQGTRISAEASQSGGNAGRVRILTRELTIQDRARVTASNISGESDDVSLTGLRTLRVLSGGEISASTNTGIAGDVVINSRTNPANFVLIRGNGSRLAVETVAGGDGSSSDDKQPSSLSQLALNSQNTSGASDSPQAGSLTVFARQLTVGDGGEVTVSSDSGEAGNLNVTANALSFDRGTLAASTATTPTDTSDDERTDGGANIILNIGDYSFFSDESQTAISSSLFLANESLIEANATGDATGGNITINAPDGFIIATRPSGTGSDITANAEGLGNGGTIRITALGLIGIAFRNELTPFNDITAIALNGGLPGFVDINTLGIDPSRGLEALPESLVTVPPLDAVCRGDAGITASRFVMAGRGGLPSSPNDLLPGYATTTSWVTRDMGSELPSVSRGRFLPVPDAISDDNTNDTTDRMEAQGWAIASEGTVTLVSNHRDAIPSASGQPDHHQLCQ